MPGHQHDDHRAHLGGSGQERLYQKGRRWARNSLREGGVNEESSSFGCLQVVFGALDVRKKRKIWLIGNW